MHYTAELLIQFALQEDIGSGDLTANYFVPADMHSHALVVAREDGVCAGIELAVQVFHAVDQRLKTTILRKDGQAFDRGQTLLEIRGPTRAILSAERTALNFLQRLCGIATQTRRYVDAVQPHPVTDLGYPENHARLAFARKSGGQSRGGHQSPNGPLRPCYGQRQSFSGKWFHP